jgi:hypothetical protein
MTKKEDADKQVWRHVDLVYGIRQVRPLVEADLGSGSWEAADIKHVDGLIRTLVEINEVIANMPTVKSVAEPPRWAEGLIVLFGGSGKRAEAVQGDLCERFTRDCATMTVDRARWLYRARVLRSLLPLVKRTIARAVKLTAIISAAKRFIIG